MVIFSCQPDLLRIILVNFSRCQAAVFLLCVTISLNTCVVSVLRAAPSRQQKLSALVKGVSGQQLSSVALGSAGLLAACQLFFSNILIRRDKRTNNALLTLLRSALRGLTTVGQFCLSEFQFFSLVQFSAAVGFHFQITNHLCKLAY